MYVATLQLTEPVVKSIPEIIKQASQSQRGILALLVIVLFGLALYFFRKAPIGVRVLIWLVLFGASVTYGWEITRVANKSPASHYVGRVIDKASSAPLSEALVSLLPTPQTQPWSTDSDGKFSFWVQRRRPSDDVQMTIDHPKYEKYVRTLSSDEGNELGNISLVPSTASSNSGGSQRATSSTPAVGSNPSSSPPAATIAHPDGAATAGVIGRSSAPSIAMAMMAAAAPPKVATVSSGPKLSGAGKDWSEWYRLSVGAAPQGYTVEKSEFWLSGDRACAAWAECREVGKNDQEVAWEFRLQGHDEWGAPPQAYSEGHLRVTYTAK